MFVSVTYTPCETIIVKGSDFDMFALGGLKKKDVRVNPSTCVWYCSWYLIQTKWKKQSWRNFSECIY